MCDSSPQSYTFSPIPHSYTMIFYFARRPAQTSADFLPCCIIKSHKCVYS